RQSKHRTAPGGRAAPWVLSGLAYCAECGAPLWGAERVQQGGRYRYPVYFCSTSARHGVGTRCRRTNSVNRDDLQGAVIRRLKARLLDPEALATLRAELARQAEAGAAGLEARRQELRDRLAALDRQIDQGNTNLTILPADRVPGVVAKLR